MILLKDIRDYIATLKIAEKENCYFALMSDKKDKSIGAYSLKSGRTPRKTAGGEKNNSYLTKGVSFLVHWNKSPTETEKAAISLYEAIKATRNVTVNEHFIICTEMSHEEPVPVGTDDRGIFEYVIECIFYVRKDN